MAQVCKANMATSSNQVILVSAAHGQEDDTKLASLPRTLAYRSGSAFSSVLIKFFISFFIFISLVDQLTSCKSVWVFFFFSRSEESKVKSHKWMLPLKSMQYEQPNKKRLFHKCLSNGCDVNSVKPKEVSADWKRLQQKYLMQLDASRSQRWQPLNHCCVIPKSDCPLKGRGRITKVQLMWRNMSYKCLPPIDVEISTYIYTCPHPQEHLLYFQAEWQLSRPGPLVALSTLDRKHTSTMISCVLSCKHTLKEYGNIKSRTIPSQCKISTFSSD